MRNPENDLFEDLPSLEGIVLEKIPEEVIAMIIEQEKFNPPGMELEFPGGTFQRKDQN